MNQLNVRYLISIICRFVMYVCLFILFINIYNNIDQFRHDNKKVRLESLVSSDYDGERMDKGDGVPESLSKSGSFDFNKRERGPGHVRPQRHNSLYRFD